ncbi:unnamed protein product [Oppiella nova]|uniref:Uncharacterized protein n=1 Tax=Oppiella nova TaxID=334625 RepID=A0A7R9QVY4_9ACAR|nr:unnamed protein product [Oppiella nova]CAG2177612.1 unnamed protein product [Oppiella nova]
MRSMIAILTLLFVVFTIGDSINVNQNYAKTVPRVSPEFKGTFSEDFQQGKNASTFALESANNCWVCYNPCAMIYCCDDGYPQCCIVGGYCGCCRG